ncbi:MAG: ceramidase domain-containing protein, partial [Acidobacteriaceae bacterium]|nr:ceramidase domain-containing protein [Acidobacteriaceae bacterium]
MEVILRRIRQLDTGVRIAILVAATAALLVATMVQPPIHQPASYHRFADHRGWFGIANFFDVASSLGFLATGVMGLAFLLSGKSRRGARFCDLRERWPYAVVFAGFVLTCFGSICYHLDPNNKTLVWDRLPMTLIFTGLLAAVVCERISVRGGLVLEGLLMPIGLWTVLYWRAGDAHGSGDLRFYLLTQLLPIFGIPLIMAFFLPRYTSNKNLTLVLGFYVIAKICELWDRQIYAAGHFLSGHTWKHIFSAIAAYYLVRMLKTRK